MGAETPLDDRSSCSTWNKSFCYLVGAARRYELKNNLLHNSNDNFEANVFLKEPLGDVTILDIAINNNKLKMILPEEEAIKYDVGKNMKVTIDPSKAYLFTSDTGVNINMN